MKGEKMSMFSVTYKKTMLVKFEADDFDEAEAKAYSMTDEEIEKNGVEIGYPWELWSFRQLPD